MAKLNKLTEKLIAEGYSADNYPNYVKLPSGQLSSKNPLDNIYGGFEYVRMYTEDLTYETACGLLCKGKSVMTGTTTNGTQYCYENDNPLVVCPYHKHECTNESVTICLLRCPVHPTDREYTYEGSVEQIEDLHQKEIERQKEEFIKARNGRVCENHMRYSEASGWTFNYDPSICAGGYCTACTMGDTCPVLGKQLSKEKGNVYYDIEQTGTDHSKDGTLFEGEKYHTITKGKQKFKKPVSIDICNAYVKVCSEELKREVLINNYHTELFFAELHNEDLQINIINIRVAKKAARDIDQDIADVQAGIEVVHESDLRKDREREKKAHREELRAAKVKKYEKRILKIGWDEIDDYEKNRILKVLSIDRIDELDAEFQQKEYDRTHEPLQLSLFDV